MASEVSERIRSMLADAEGAADAIRHEAEQDAQSRKRAAETEALQVVEEARREAERFLTDRIERVSRLSDEILERGQSVVERLDEADAVRAELAGLVTALGETAARLANEVRSMPGPKSPDIAAPPARREWAEPDPPAAAEPELRDEDPEPGRTLAPESPAPAIEPNVLEPNAIEPTPLRAEPSFEAAEPPAPVDPDPEPEAPSAVDDAPIPEPTPEEIELLERVRQAERERSGEGESDGGTPEVVELRSAEPEPEPEPVEEPAQEPAGAATPDDGPSSSGDQALGARLVALQMAVAGGNRGEVESHLRRAFDLEQPGAILDDIFGSGSDSEKRVAWPEAG